MPTAYTIRVRTGTALYAGTDATIYITLYGTNGDSGERRLGTSIDDFERGMEDSFSVETYDLGDLTRVRIRHDNTGADFFGNLTAGWFLETIVVYDEANRREWVFPCNRWLARDEDDRSIDRVLGPA